MAAPTLIEKYVARTGSPILRDLMLFQIEQAMVEYAALILKEANPSPPRKDFAALAILQPAPQGLRRAGNPAARPGSAADPAVCDR